MSNSNSDTAFFGHPKGLQTLFFTEMWERMSYYGMRAMLVLFMTATMQEGGLAITAASATAIYGLYTGAVYFLGLPGGWMADRLIGGQRAVWYGGLIIMSGHIVLALPSSGTFFIGLILVALGTGLLKPNISALVGALYGTADERRDSGFTIYYLGINIGSLIGYTVCGYLRINVGWHWAFGAAAVGMAIGLIQYRRTLHHMNGAGAKPTLQLSAEKAKKAWMAIWSVLAGVAVLTYLMISGMVSFSPVTVAQYVAVAITLVFLACYAYIVFFGGLDQNEKRRVGALFVVCLASICFWCGFEQAGSSLNLFGRDFTDRMVGTFEIPPEWLQSANSTFILILSPFFAYLWISLAKKLITPSSGFKCVLGLAIMATGFLVMFFAAQIAASGLKVAPYWLVATYFLHTVGELCLSPVALSAVSKLSPRRYAGQMMGLFVLTYSIGSVVAGLLAGHFDPNNVEEMPGLFMQIALATMAFAAVILILVLKTRHWERLPSSDKGGDVEEESLHAGTLKVTS